jgi:serpin B
MSSVNLRNISPFAQLVALIVVSCFFARCTPLNQETESKTNSRNLLNSSSTFIYNMIPPNTAADISSGYAAAINAFSVNLLDKIYTSNSYLGKNVVVSPFCASLNLAIITEATTGTSQTELLGVLGGRPALDDARPALCKLLYADNSVVLQIADAVWVDSTKYSLLPSFRDTANKKYGVQATGLDFSNVQGSVAAINQWIANNTANLVTNVVDESYITPFTALLLTNTIYFKADWTSPFDVTQTAPHPFSTPTGTVDVSMMTSKYQHKTRKTADYENVRLYYGTNAENFFYLDVYMPESISVEEFIGQKCLAALTNQDSMGYGGLRMPKFFFENLIDLKPVLQNMGVNGAFDPNAGEITGMAFDKSAQDNAHLHIERIVQKAGIKTDEEGTVAYAVTVSGLFAGSAASGSPDVVLDRPFVYFIRAGATGLVLFAGVVNNPNEKT